MGEAPLRWRLLEDGIEDPFRHFAVEETILRRVAEGLSEPTFRLRRVWPSVFIGVYQDPREDVNIAYCRRKGIAIIRRPNPGGAVYQDHGGFCFTAFFPKHPTFEVFGIRETRDMYRVMGERVVAMCRALGVSAQAAPVNDVVVGGRKVYGSAQIEMGDAVAHSGTLLIDTDIEVMEAALRPSRLKFLDKGFSSVRERVLNLAEAAGRPIAIREAMDLLTQGITESLPVALIPGGLTEAERQAAERLYRDKYAKEEWTFPRRQPFSTTLATKAQSGVVMLDLVLDGNHIESIAMRGDFLLERQEDLASLLQAMHGRTIPEAIAILPQGGLPEDVQDALARLLDEGSKHEPYPETRKP
jgi:lipoate-protein ligase A